MQVSVLKELRPNEARVAASPVSIKKMVQKGHVVVVEQGAGLGAAITDAAFEEAGARIARSAKDTVKGADVVLKVQRPTRAESKGLPKGALLISHLDPYRGGEEVSALAAAGVTAFAMELVPRITRAQSMDVLSSQANLAGYKAVIEAAAEYGRAFPMMMTAAGKVSPANVLIMGAGVAGLQAIATARRLGAVVHATDVRPAAKEQVESLGGKFVAVEDEEFKQAETAGGYAKQMSAEYQKKQAALIAETLPKMDLVITTALIPGRPAPRLISAEMVASMKPGSVIVDLAVETGGNCALSVADQVVEINGVKIVGYSNMASRLAAATSSLYANNLLNFLDLLTDKDSAALAIDWNDEIVAAALVAKDGALVNEAVAKAVKEMAAARPAAKAKAAPKAKTATTKTAGKKAASNKPSGKKAARLPGGAKGKAAAKPAAGEKTQADKAAAEKNLTDTTVSEAAGRTKVPSPAAQATGEEGKKNGS